MAAAVSTTKPRPWRIVTDEQVGGHGTCLNCGEPVGCRHRPLCHQAMTAWRASTEPGTSDRRPEDG